MRRQLLLIATALVVGGGLYFLLNENQGFILVSLGNYVIELSLWATLILVVAAWLLLRLWRRLLRLLWLPGSRLRKWRVQRTTTYRARTARGLLEYIEGRWPQALKTLKRAGPHSDMPLVTYLAAATAAFELDDREEMQALLVRAEQVQPGSDIAVGLVQARLLLRNARFEEVLAILSRLHSKSPGHPYLLRLLAQTYRGLRDWQNLEKLLPDIQRHKAMAGEDLQSLQVETFEALLLGSGSANNCKSEREQLECLLHTWDAVPSNVRRNSRLLAAYVTRLQQLGDTEHAESRLRKAINQHWDDQLVRLYGVLKASDPGKQIVVAETWLREHPNNASLLLTLGRLCQRSELWGKAKEYLEQSLKLASHPETYVELARLTAQRGDHAQSAAYYQQGLLQTIET